MLYFACYTNFRMSSAIYSHTYFAVIMAPTACLVQFSCQKPILNTRSITLLITTAAIICSIIVLNLNFVGIILLYLMIYTCLARFFGAKLLI